MGSGGGGGGYNSVTQSEPWAGQSKYLTPLFRAAMYGATGNLINPEWDPGTEKTTSSGTESTTKYIKPADSGFYGDIFSGVGVPGDLEYFGNQGGLNSASGGWESDPYILEALAGGRYGSGNENGAPTVARFTDNEIAAQKYAANLAESRLDSTGAPTSNSLLGRSNTALGNIISGSQFIPDYNIATPTISSPGSVTGADINYNPNMSAASVNYNPAMQAATFDYKYWDDLGEMAGGNGGNPYLDEMVTAATRGLTSRYENDIVPYLNSTAQEAGGTPGGAWSDLRSKESQNYLNSLVDVEKTIRGNAFNSQLQAQLAALGLGGEFADKAAGYTQEANRLNTELGLNKALANAGYTQEANQLNTQFGLQKGITEAGYEQEAGMENVANALQRAIAQSGMEADINKQNALLGTSIDTQNIANIMQGITQAPDINAAGYNDIGALSATGAEQRTYNQDVINAYIQRMEQMNLEPWNRLALLSQLIGGNFGGTITQTAQNA